MWPFNYPEDPEGDFFSRKKGDYPHQVILGEAGPNPKMVANQIDDDLIYIKRGGAKIYGFKTAEAANRFRKIYG